MKTKTMYYRLKATANTTEQTIYNASTLAELFSQTNKIDFDEDFGLFVNIGKTALEKMNRSSFLSRSLFSTYAFGSLGFTNAITATAIISAVNYGLDFITIGSKIRIYIDGVSNMPQGLYIHCTAKTETIEGIKEFMFTLTASYKDSTAEKRQALNNNRIYNKDRGYIPLNKTENNFSMRFCENVYIGNFDAFAFNLMQ